MTISIIIYSLINKVLPLLPSAIAAWPIFERFRNGDRWIEFGEINNYEPNNEIIVEFRSIYKTDVHIIKVTEISGGLEFDRIDKQDTTFYTKERNAKGETYRIISGKWHSLILFPTTSKSGIIELKFQLGDSGFRFNTRIEIMK